MTEATLTYSELTTSQIELVLPKNALVTPWGTPISFTFYWSEGFAMHLPKVPKSVCSLIIMALSANKNFTFSGRAQIGPGYIGSVCPEALTGELTITYNRDIK